MRDGRRVREKFDISLEPKQVALLFVLCLVILVLVFALGIIVGRGLKNPTGMPETAQTAEGEEPPVETAMLEGNPAPGDATGAEEAPKLKFYAEGSNAPQREVSAVAPGAEEAPEAPIEGADAAGSTPVPAPAPVKPVAEKPAKAEKPKAESKKNKVVAKKEDAKPRAAGKFTVQVSAFQNRGQADHLVSQLKHKGYDAYIAQAAIPGKGTWYRVRIGKYGSRDDAQATANKLKRKEGISTYVTLHQ